jgi:hypothetical protein
MPEGGYNRYSQTQLSGSEYSGINYTKNTLQPGQALNNGDKLRLGYLVGDVSNANYELTTSNIEDHRQMMGLLPASQARPTWLANSGKIPQAEISGAEYPDDLAGGV